MKTALLFVVGKCCWYCPFRRECASACIFTSII